MGISEEMYKNALNEMKVANEAIAKCNKEGKPITLTDVKPSIQESKKKATLFLNSLLVELQEINMAI